MQRRIKVDERRQIALDARNRFGDAREPARCRHDDDCERRVDNREEGSKRKKRRERGWQAAAFEPFEQRHERDRDDDRRGERKEEFRAGLQGKGQSQAECGAEDQRERGKQPVAAKIVDLDLVQRIDARRTHILAAPVLRHPASPC